MNSWEARWSRSNPGAPPPRAPMKPTLPRGPINEYPTSRFGAEFGVGTVIPSQYQPAPVVVSSGGGGSFSNAVMLVLGGFAVGTLWGEGLIGKMLGEKHRSSP